MKITSLVIAALFCAPVWAEKHDEHKQQPKPAGFDTIKAFEGTWEGTANMEGKDTPVKTVFEITSGGNVITEKMGPGTEHEMINVYHADGKRMAMTHYCAMGNRPLMIMKKADDKTVTFEMEKPVGIGSMKEPHMHAVTFNMIDKDTMEQEWTNMMNGKKQEKVVFKYKRKK